MQLGMVGLGRMGANMARRLMGGGHDLVVYDLNAETVTRLQAEGATGRGRAARTPVQDPSASRNPCSSPP